MKPQEFLETVLPSAGRICILRLGNSLAPEQKFFDTIEEALEHVEGLIDGGFDLYYGCGTYGDKNNRTEANVLLLRSFRLDIDIKDGKYESEEQALERIDEFVAKAGLPDPMLVRSGGGFHVYWPMVEELEPGPWRKTAEGLKRLCAEMGLPTDAGITADVARVLRVPGTINQKYSPVRIVEVIRTAPATPHEAFREAIANHVPMVDFDAIPAQARADGATQLGLDPNVETYFRKILVRGKDDPQKGCRQLIHAVQNAAALTEPQWRAALSVAWRCKDAAKAVEAVSRGHPGYDPELTREKAEKTAGPFTCAKFEENDPALCAGCIHKGKIKSPIVLGMEIAEAAPATGEEHSNGKDTIPQYPFPFFRGKHGGVYKRPDSDDDEGGPQLIYEYDLYMVDRIEDPNWGETGVFRLHLPNDPPREFSITLASMTSKEELRKELSQYGIVLYGAKKLESMMWYVTTWVKHMQKEKPATVGSHQFGWTADHKSFIIGDEQYTPDGVQHCAASAPTEQFVETLSAKGTLDKWRPVVDLYDRPGMEKYQLGICAGFGSILYPLSGTDGGLLMSYESVESGHGKSYLIYVINSIFGHPRDGVLGAQSTDNAIISRLGVYKSLPVHIDEVTKWSSERMSDFIYAYNNGVGKSRMERSSNKERKNHSRWSNIAFMTSNSMVYTKLTETRSLPLGEMARVFPVQMTEPLTMDQTEADKVFALMYENYGLAGRVFIEYCVSRVDSLRLQIAQIRERLIQKVGFKHQHRFWASGMAATLVAGTVAKHLGLIGFDMQKLSRWVLEYCGLVLGKTLMVEDSMNGRGILDTFLMENINATIVASKATTAQPLTAIVTPKGKELNVRIDPKTTLLYLRSAAFNTFCARHGLDPDGAMTNMRRAGMQVERGYYRLASGSTFGTNVVSRVIKVILPPNLQKDLTQNTLPQLTGEAPPEDSDGAGEAVGDPVGSDATGFEFLRSDAD